MLDRVMNDIMNGMLCFAVILTAMMAVELFPYQIIGMLILWVMGVILRWSAELMSKYRK